MFVFLDFIVLRYHCKVLVVSDTVRFGSSRRSWAALFNLIAFKTDIFRSPGRKQDDRDVESLDIVLDCLRDLENLIQI